MHQLTHSSTNCHSHSSTHLPLAFKHQLPLTFKPQLPLHSSTHLPLAFKHQLPLTCKHPSPNHHSHIQAPTAALGTGARPARGHARVVQHRCGGRRRGGRKPAKSPTGEPLPLSRPISATCPTSSHPLRAESDSQGLHVRFTDRGFHRRVRYAARGPHERGRPQEPAELRAGVCAEGGASRDGAAHVRAQHARHREPPRPACPLTIGAPAPIYQ